MAGLKVEKHFMIKLTMEADNCATTENTLKKKYINVLGMNIYPNVII